MKKQQIGIVGMAVMGKNLALNISDHGFSISIFNRTVSTAQDVARENPHSDIVVAKTAEEFVASLETPRKMILMVKAGKAVDETIAAFLPYLEPGDLLIDAGNSYYQDTIRRQKTLEEKGFRFMGMGVSGGEEGARKGPAIMPGGRKESYELVKDVLVAIAAKAEGEACTTYIGSDGAGHYVKMVHNGIEYGDMEIIAEAYSVLSKLGRFTNQELGEIFTQWNQGELNSYLIEITAAIFKEKDDLSDADLIDVIKDTAGQKGTGIWTSKEAMDLGIDVSVISSAVNSRFISAFDQQRELASKQLTGPNVNLYADRGLLVEKVKSALYASKIVSYAQGFSLLKAAAKQYGWELDYKAIAKIFRGGCIIRAKFLNRIAEAYEKNPQLENLLLDDYFAKIVRDAQQDWREVVGLSIANGIPVSAFAAAISYYDAFRTVRYHTNLIQAQRDFFGAHTYQRTDRDGFFHHQFPGTENE
ncbi:MAG: phosphogluconate dehydrogenase (NADP(+)-dependent, decarboxylating) [Firmicutes bacterium GWF2_51_9]|nr:MAG: phosphogluconate dehydrogenase (NADP(+)-dependent, decarboxylating) [Firmicutes bacterium GWF2_51_9]OGS58020.1 MAG: phosphogluconate dehydrogenase (NADP(+)-dependent, decarboxylating) [Firmicutes bacterium GWE2_51_13]HBZ42444.1 phosphogluconate dehydrogenase (NADP(+)-dependent, decarboxylating) [Erysipelotrichaceae bacterium]